MNRHLLLTVCALACGAAQAQTSDIARCRAMQDSGQRLACYDAIPLSAAAPSADAAAAAGRAAPAVAAAKPAPEFGLENQPRADRVEEINSRIVGSFDGWDAKSRFRLENGQLWKVVDGSRASYNLQSPGVRVRRGLLGSFLMEIDGVSQLIRVRRVE